jgi:ABC-type Fe3+-siderophore transport system permease subunit
MTRFPRILMAATLGAGLALSSVSMAQVSGAGGSGSQSRKTEERLMPPTPSKQDNPTLILYYILAIVIVGACVGVMLIPSRRGHQD